MGDGKGQAVIRLSEGWKENYDADVFLKIDYIILYDNNSLQIWYDSIFLIFSFLTASIWS